MVQFQIRADFVFIHIEFCLTGFIRIITPVPTFGFEVAAFLLYFGIDIGQFFLRFFQRRSPNLVKQVIHILLVLCHVLIQHKSGKVFITQQFGLIQAGSY